LECLGHDPADIDTLAERCGLTPQAVSSMLLALELRGRVATLAGGRYQRVS
jgi:DNA processing protein